MTVRNEQSRELLIRTFTLRADTIDETSRSVEAVLCTETPTTVFDMRSWEPVDEVLLMDGWEPDDQVVLVDSHPQVRNGGTITSADVHGSVRDIRIQGKQQVGRLFFADDPESLALWGKVRDKHVRDLSVGAQPMEQVEISPRASADVGGKTYRAKDRRMFITTRWRLGEVSVTPRGADPKAKIRQAVAAGPFSNREQVMNELLRAYLESLGLAADADEPAATAFLNKLEGTQRAYADKLAATVATPPAGTGTTRAAVTTPAPTQPAAAPAGQPAAAVVPPAVPGAETVRAEAVNAERARVARIQELAGSDIPQETVRQAINEGWDEARASLTFLNMVRAARTAPVAGGGPAIHSRNHDTDCTLRALQVGLMHRTGTRVIDPRASETVRAQQERDAELGHRYRDMPMVDLCREALRLEGRTIPHTREELVRAAVSGSTLSAIFSTNVNARLMMAFEEYPDTTEGMCFETDVPNFLKQERTSVGKQGTPKKLPRGGTAKHVSTSDEKEEFKIARYANQLVVDEQDFIDDNLGGMQRWVTEMGMGCARLRPDMFYAMLLANAAMRDGIALFHASHSNLVSGGGTALSPTSLAAGVTAMASQVQDTVQLNLNPVFLVVPQALRFTAAPLLRSAELRDTTASTKYPTYNPIQDLNLTLRVDNRIGANGVFDPDSETLLTGTATNWFLVAEAVSGKTAECAYLAGTGRRPVIRPFTLDRGQWGLGWDVKMDIGIKALDWRGWYKSAGA